MKNSLRSSQVLSLLRSPSIYRSRRMQVQALPANSLGFAFSINKKFGNAAKRNLFKRQIRAMMKNTLTDCFPFHFLIRVLAPLQPSFLSEKERKTLFIKIKKTRV